MGVCGCVGYSVGVRVCVCMGIGGVVIGFFWGVCVVVVACFLEFRESHRTNINGTHRHVGVYVPVPTPPSPKEQATIDTHTHI